MRCDCNTSCHEVHKHILSLFDRDSKDIRTSDHTSILSNQIAFSFGPPVKVLSNNTAPYGPTTGSYRNGRYSHIYITTQSKALRTTLQFFFYVQTLTMTIDIDLFNTIQVHPVYVLVGVTFGVICWWLGYDFFLPKSDIKLLPTPVSPTRLLILC